MKKPALYALIVGCCFGVVRGLAAPFLLDSSLLCYLYFGAVSVCVLFLFFALDRISSILLSVFICLLVSDAVKLLFLYMTTSAAVALSSLGEQAGALCIIFEEDCFIKGLLVGSLLLVVKRIAAKLLQRRELTTG